MEPWSKRLACSAASIWSSPHGLVNDLVGIISLSMLLSVTHPKPGTGCDPVSSEALLGLQLGTVLIPAPSELLRLSSLGFPPQR